MVEQKELTKGKAAVLFALSALTAIVSAMRLHGWHVYLGLGIAALAIFLGFLAWNRKF